MEKGKKGEVEGEGEERRGGRGEWRGGRGRKATETAERVTGIYLTKHSCLVFWLLGVCVCPWCVCAERIRVARAVWLIQNGKKTHHKGSGWCYQHTHTHIHTLSLLPRPPPPFCFH